MNNAGVFTSSYNTYCYDVDPSVFFTSDDTEIVSFVRNAIKVATVKEGNTSTKLWNTRSLYRELKAKENAKFNAYGRYHCF